MKALLLALLLMPQASVAAQHLLLPMSVNMSVPVPEPTSDAQLSYDADTAVVITFTAPAGKTLATNTLTCTAVTNDEFEATVSEFPAGFFTDVTPPVTYSQAVSLLYQCSGSYTDGLQWSSEFPVDIFETGASSSAPPTEEQQQTEVATAALEATAAITDPFIQSMNDSAYMNYLTARVNEWTAMAAFWCDTGNLPLQCNRVDQRRVGWFRARQFFTEHLQGSSPLSKSDCALTIMVADAEANLELEPFFYSFLADPQQSC